MHAGLGAPSKLCADVQEGQLKPQEHVMGQLSNAPIWEYVNPRDPRAALVVPQHLVGVA